MGSVKQFIIYAVGLIVGNFCGQWASKIASETFGIRGARFISDKVMVPTNISGGIELLVIVVVFVVTVQIIERTGILK